jgi:hypothetical protein
MATTATNCATTTSRSAKRDRAGGVTGYVLSADGKKLLWRQRDKFGIADAKPGSTRTRRR